MFDFFGALLQHSFLQYAALAAVLSGIACGISGTFVVMRKISYLGGGIAHAVMGGLGIAYFLELHPMLGAFAFALLAALVIGWIKLRFSQNEDVLIGAVWAIGMAIGIIFTSLTPGYRVDLLSFLFGNILMISSGDLQWLALLDAGIVALALLFYRQLVYVCFDEEYAALRGVAVQPIYLLLLCLIAVTVVIVIQAVGLILVIALLTLPAATATLFAHSPFRIMLGAIGLSTACSLAGLYMSFTLDLPAGASIILLAGCAYILALVGHSWLEHLQRKKHVVHALGASSSQD